MRYAQLNITKFQSRPSDCGLADHLVFQRFNLDIRDKSKIHFLCLIIVLLESQACPSLGLDRAMQCAIPEFQ